MGMATEKDRSIEAEKIANWAFREFSQKTVVTKGTRLADAPVWMGALPQVGLVTQEDVSLLLPSLAQDTLKAEVVYTGPLQAPIEAGQKLADLVITVPGTEPATIPLVAEQAVAKGGFTTRLRTAFGVLSAKALAAAGS